MKAGITLAAGMLAFVAGCTGQPAAQEPVPAVTVTVTATATATATVTATPSSPVAPTGRDMKLGESYKMDSATVTALEVKRNLVIEGGEGVTTAINVKVCISIDNVTVSPAPWSLVDAETGRWGTYTTSPGRGLPGPAYPFEERVLKGECVKGWLYFEHPKATKITAVRYSASTGEPKQWILP